MKNTFVKSAMWVISLQGFWWQVVLKHVLTDYSVSHCLGTNPTRDSSKCKKVC